MTSSNKIFAFSEQDKYAFALRMGDCVSLRVGEEELFNICLPQSNDKEIEQVAAQIVNLVDMGCVNTKILAHEDVQASADEVGAFIEQLADEVDFGHLIQPVA